MGGDGGSIPRRIEQVKVKRKTQRLERDLENLIKWRTCAHSQLPLKAPIVACKLGRLYSKEIIIEALLEKQLSKSEITKHIRSLKDVKTLNLTGNPAYDPNKIEKGNEYSDGNLSPYICPVSGLEMNGTHRFVVIWKCGCVLSEKAFNEIRAEKCHVCNQPFERDSDVILLNPTAEELAVMKAKLEQGKADAKLAKKSKSKTMDGATEQAAACSSTDEPPKLVKPDKHNLKRPATAHANDKDKKKTKDIQKDPGTSQVFKNLFTSSDLAKSKPTAHWATFDPRYF